MCVCGCVCMCVFGGWGVGKFKKFTVNQMTFSTFWKSFFFFFFLGARAGARTRTHIHGLFDQIYKRESPQLLRS